MSNFFTDQLHESWFPFFQDLEQKNKKVYKGHPFYILIYKNNILSLNNTMISITPIENGVNPNYPFEIYLELLEIAKDNKVSNLVEIERLIEEYKSEHLLRLKLKQTIKNYYLDIGGGDAMQSKKDPYFFIDSRTVARDSQLRWLEQAKKEKGNNWKSYVYLAVHNEIQTIII